MGVEVQARDVHTHTHTHTYIHTRTRTSRVRHTPPLALAADLRVWRLSYRSKLAAADDRAYEDLLSQQATIREYSET